MAGASIDVAKGIHKNINQKSPEPPAHVGTSNISVRRCNLLYELLLATIVTPLMFEANRLLITEESFLLIEGRLQNSENVIHIKAEKIQRLDHGLFTSPAS